MNFYEILFRLIELFAFILPALPDSLLVRLTILSNIFHSTLLQIAI